MICTIPSPGHALPFEQWAKALVAALRELLPEIRATRKGGVVTLRHRNSERAVTITEDAGTYWIKTTDVGPAMATLHDSERQDEQTARTFALEAGANPAAANIALRQARDLGQSAPGVI